jgi:hypothetical protein
MVEDRNNIDIYADIIIDVEIYKTLGYVVERTSYKSNLDKTR